MRCTHGGEGGEKCLVGPKEQRKQQEEHMEGTGGFRGYAGIWAVPRQGSVNSCLCSLGFPPARAREGSRRGSHHSHQIFTAWGGGLATKQLPAVPCGCLGWVLLCFVPGWRVLGAVSGVWSPTWKLKTTKGDTHMESHFGGRRGKGWGRQTKQDHCDFVC